MPGYVTDHDLALPTAREAAATSNETSKKLLERQLVIHVNETAADIELQPSTSSDAAATPRKQASEAPRSRWYSGSESITPVHVRPFPKAQPRNNKRNKRTRKRKSEILTDTPVKTALQQRKINKKVISSKHKKRSLFSKKVEPDSLLTTQKKKKKLIALTKQEWYCLVCMDSYSNSQSREVWVQCCMCKNWAHEKCISFSQSYVCQNCY